MAVFSRTTNLLEYKKDILKIRLSTQGYKLWLQLHGYWMLILTKCFVQRNFNIVLAISVCIRYNIRTQVLIIWREEN